MSEPTLRTNPEISSIQMRFREKALRNGRTYFDIMPHDDGTVTGITRRYKIAFCKCGKWVYADSEYKLHNLMDTHDHDCKHEVPMWEMRSLPQDIYRLINIFHNRKTKHYRRELRQLKDYDSIVNFVQVNYYNSMRKFAAAAKAHEQMEANKT